MTADAKVTKHLMETLKDGKDGFNSAAELLEDNSRSELASQFVSSHNSGPGSISRGSHLHQGEALPNLQL